MARYLYRPGHPRASRNGFVSVEDLGEDVPVEDGRVPVFTDRYMEGVRTTDGIDIGSRQKRRDYMRANGLADADDYSDDFRARVKAERAREDMAHLRETVGRTAYEVKHGKRR
jgi:hypothetical protein